MLEEKYIQFYLVDPGIHSLLAERDWDSRLYSLTGDYMVVEANDGFIKSNSRLERAYTYNVDLMQSPTPFEIDTILHEY